MYAKPIDLLDLNFHPICQVVLPSLLTDSIKRPSLLLNRLKEGLTCLVVWLKLQANGSLHTDIIHSYIEHVVCRKQRLCGC